MREESQRDLVRKLVNENMNFTEIGTLMGISRHAVRSLHVYKRVSHPKKRGRQFILQSKQKLKIKRTVSMLKSAGERVDASKLKLECQLNVSSRTIRRHLGGIGMKYKNVRRRIFLTKTHKEKRVQMAKEWITNNHDWSKTIFSDEKRFSLDGPDNWMTYIGRNEIIERNMRQCKGGGVMVWLMVMPNGLLSYKIIEGKFDSKDYLALLKTSVVPISKLNYGMDYFFQEDNCSVHKAKIIQNFMNTSKINILKWPAKSPDLNIVEDIWKMLSNDIYDGVQFKKISDLKEKINDIIFHFNSTKREKIQALYSTIRKRLCTLLMKHGNLCK